MTRFCYILLFHFFAVLPIFAQKSINGHVYIHNSKTKTGELKIVPLVSITSLGSTGCVSDGFGHYLVAFGNAPPGTMVTLRVKDPSNMEVVNHTEMTTLLARVLPLDIYLATSEDIALAETEFYQISKEKLFAEKNAALKKLRGTVAEKEKEIKVLEERYGKKLATSAEAEELLEAKVAEMEAKLPEFARKMAEVNLDFASNIYKDAYAAYQESNIERAILLLDSSQLNDALEKALTDKKKGEVIKSEGEAILKEAALQMEQLKESWYLKANLFEIKSQFADALYCYEQILNIQSQNNEGATAMGETYLLAAYSCYDANKMDNFLKYINHTLAVCEKEPDKFILELAVTYDLLAMYHLDRVEYKEALKYMRKAIASGDRLVDEDLKKSHFYSNLAKVLAEMKEYNEAMKSMDIAINLFNSNAKPYGLGIYLYNQYAVIAMNSEDALKAMRMSEKAVLLIEQNPDADYTAAAVPYMNYGYTLREQGENEKATAALQKGLNLMTTREIPDFYQIAVCYRNLAEIALSETNTTSYDFRIEKSLENIVKAECGNYLKGKFYYILADVHEKAGQLDKMASALENALAFYKGFATTGEMADVSLRLAMTYAKNGQFDKGLDMGLKALDLKLTSGESSANVVEYFYETIGAIYEHTNIEKAVEYHKKALDASIKNKKSDYIRTSDIYKHLAICSLVTEDYHTAIIYYESAVTILVKHQDKVAIALLGDCYGGLANAHYNLSQYDQSLHYIEKTKTMYSADDPTQEKIKDFMIAVRFDKGIDAFDAGSYKRALEDFMNIENYTAIDSALYMAGRCRYHLGKYDEALTDFDKASGLSSSYRDHEYNSDIGLAYSKQGKFTEADKAFNAYAAMFPENAASYRNWAFYYLLKGDEVHTLENLRKALRLEPEITKTWLKQTNEFKNLQKSEKYKEIIKEQLNK